jgi:hypothetical protein
MKKEKYNPVPPEIQAEIDALAASQEPIRTDLIPEATGDWSNARRGVFYRPIKPPNKRPSISRGSGGQTLPKKPLLVKNDRRIEALIQLWVPLMSSIGVYFIGSTATVKGHCLGDGYKHFQIYYLRAMDHRTFSVH